MGYKSEGIRKDIPYCKLSQHDILCESVKILLFCGFKLNAKFSLRNLRIIQALQIISSDIMHIAPCCDRIRIVRIKLDVYIHKFLSFNNDEYIVLAEEHNNHSIT